MNPDFASSVSVVSVRYFESESNVDCSIHKNVLMNTVLAYAAFCVDGFADVSVYIQPTGDPTDECLSCRAPEESGSSVNAYYYTVPCVPICVPIDTVPTAPSPAPQTVIDLDCYPGAQDVTPVGANKCPYVADSPIEIVAMDIVSVMFKVKNIFGTNTGCGSSDLTVRFQQEGFSAPFCNPPQTTVVNNFVSSMYRAKCVNGFAEVEVFASCKSGGRINADGRKFDTPCHASSECSHLFLVPCNPNDMCDNVVPSARRLDRELNIPVVGALMDSSNLEIDDEEDAPYCLSEDFSCEGDEPNMVYVCHYNPRKGYGTYCVPEVDSDILRFYSHDYCGPCEGGQGVTWGTMEN